MWTCDRDLYGLHYKGWWRWHYVNTSDVLCIVFQLFLTKQWSDKIRKYKTQMWSRLINPKIAICKKCLNLFVMFPYFNFFNTSYFICDLDVSNIFGHLNLVVQFQLHLVQIVPYLVLPMIKSFFFYLNKIFAYANTMITMFSKIIPWKREKLFNDYTLKFF